MPREHNFSPDFLCNHTFQRKLAVLANQRSPAPAHVLVASDAGVSEGRAVGAFIAWASAEVVQDPLWYSGFFLDATSADEAEARAALAALESVT